MTRSTTCRSCAAPMFFKPTNNGKGVPLDNAPTDDGNVALVQVPGAGEIAVTLNGETLDKARAAGTVLYTSHFVTCPDADRFKGAGKKS